MKLSDQVCTLEQAKKLKELGVEQESIWMYIYYKDDIISSSAGLHHYLIANEIFADNDGGEFDCLIASAFSVAELGVMLPEYIGELRLLQWHASDSSFGIQYRFNCDNPTTQTIPDHCIFSDTEAQARAAMLIYLLENNIITPEQVNERVKA